MNRNRMNLDLVIKANGADAEHPAGTFDAILSTNKVDREGEVIDVGAFDPLPESIPIHTDHRMTVDSVVARAVPYYDAGVLKCRGHFGSDDASQAIKTKIADGLITSMSVGAIGPTRTRDDQGVPHITKATLLEASLVSIPANTDALVLTRALAEDLEQALADPVSEVRGEAETDPAPADVGTEPAETADPRPANLSGYDLEDLENELARRADTIGTEPAETTTDPDGPAIVDSETETPAIPDPDGTAGAPVAPAAPLAQVIADTETAADNARLRALRLP